MTEDYAEKLQGDILSLLRLEPYWGRTSLTFERELNPSLDAKAGVTLNPNGTFTIYYNPDLYFKDHLPQRHAVNIHEYEHRDLLHFQRIDAILEGTCIFPVFDAETKKMIAAIKASGHLDCFYKLTNYAADMSINCMIPNIPEDAVFPKSYNFPDGLTFEHYTALLLNKLMKEQQKSQGKGGKQQQQQSGNGNGQGNGQGGDKETTEGDGEGQSQQSAPNGNAKGKSSGQGKGKKGSGSPQQSNGQAEQSGDAEGNTGGNGQGNTHGCDCPVCGGNLPGNLIGDHSQWNGQAGDISDAAKRAAEAYVAAAIREAHGRGILPGNLQAELADIIKPRMNIKALIESFLSSCISSTVRRTWNRINRRAPYSLRGKVKERTVHLIVAVDTSGSVSDTFLKLFAGILKAFVQSGAKVTVIECDAKVHDCYEFSDTLKPKFKGRCGTAFTPVFEYIAEKKLNADGIIYLTDGDGDNPPVYRGPKMLWLVTPGGRQPAPWGRTIIMPSNVMG